MNDIVNLPPEQMAEMLRQEQHAQAIAAKVLSVLNANRANPNVALAAISAVSAIVMQKIPMNVRDTYFQGFCLGIRDGAFGQTSVSMPVDVPPPPILKSK
jgi:hypothetical protein